MKGTKDEREKEKRQEGKRKRGEQRGGRRRVEFLAGGGLYLAQPQQHIWVQTCCQSNISMVLLTNLSKLQVAFPMKMSMLRPVNRFLP